MARSGRGLETVLRLGAKTWPSRTNLASFLFFFAASDALDADDAGGSPVALGAGPLKGDPALVL